MKCRICLLALSLMGGMIVLPPRLPYGSRALETSHDAMVLHMLRPLRIVHVYGIKTSGDVCTPMPHTRRGHARAVSPSAALWQP